MKIGILAVAAALLVTSAAAVAASPTGKGTSLLAIQLSDGKVDLAQPGAGGYLTSFPEAPNELGVQAQWWRFISDGFALTVGGGLGFTSEKDESSNPVNTDIKYTQTSWNVRVGGDHVAHINDRFAVFVGPGIQLWSGKWKIEGGGSPTFESKNTTRVSLEGRVGMHIQMNDRVGGFAQLGHYVGRASSSDGNAKTSWWATGHDGAAGIAFRF